MLSGEVMADLEAPSCLSARSAGAVNLKGAGGDGVCIRADEGIACVLTSFCILE